MPIETSVPLRSSREEVTFFVCHAPREEPGDNPGTATTARIEAGGFQRSRVIAPPSHSLRSAMTGSTVAARQAGIAEAKIATAIIRNAALAMLVGS